MLRRNKGKVVINTPPTIKLPTATEDAKRLSQANEVLRPILLLSLLVGYVPRNGRVRGIFGGLLWLISLVLNVAFDVLSARKHYGYAWASIQIILFISLAMCTYSSKRSALPCLEQGLAQLEKEDKYFKTFARIRKLFRIIPWVIIWFSLFSTSLLYFCFHYDDAFSVTFEQQLSRRWHIVFRVVWFITNAHTLYGFALFWCIGMCNMYALGYSMTEYHEMMTAHLKNKESPITFRQAVHSFAERGNFLRKSSSSCRVSLAFLLVYSIASLAVNAFYYLYKTRRAGYVFFALVPLICSVYPLCLAAWVTKQYKWYLAVVVKAWAECPESTDEEEESGSDHGHPVKDKHKSFARKFTKRVKSTRNKEHDKGDMKTNRRRSLFTLRGHTRSNPISTGSYSDTENQADKVIKTKQLSTPLRKIRSKPISGSTYSEHQDGGANHSKAVITYTSLSSNNENITGECHEQGLSNNQNCKSMDSLAPLPVSRQSISEDEVATDNEGKQNHRDDDDNNLKSKASRQRVMELILRGTARAVGRLQHRVKMPKFNFEKYISYLQNVIPTIGYKIMGIIVTWNMVSTLLFLEVSLLALFVQESIFGSQNAQVSL
ncbi:uncharacterized protein LOC116291358 [Actinia tenebrosa]|uniref:Uncharacterized protein LOC116291358 n=1 Tax=Actinia tenebrosa TaxID=6105 RepID=A0A6P8HDB8_ACTTE|nr:uncharacterized protein LOC116291358 [Actinia tenebrosa]